MVGELEQGQKFKKPMGASAMGILSRSRFSMPCVEWKPERPWMNRVQFLVSNLAGRNFVAVVRLDVRELDAAVNSSASWLGCQCF